MCDDGAFGPNYDCSTFNFDQGDCQDLTPTAWTVTNASAFRGCTNVGNAADYVPNVNIVVGTYVNCHLEGRVVVVWTMEVVAVHDGFDQILYYDVETASASVICGVYTGYDPPENGHVCLMFGGSGTDPSTRVRACNSAGCGAWSAWSTNSVEGKMCVRACVRVCVSVSV